MASSKGMLAMAVAGAIGVGLAFAGGGARQLGVGEVPTKAPVFTAKGGKFKLPGANQIGRRARGLSPAERVALAQRSGFSSSAMKGDAPAVVVSPAKPVEPNRAWLILSGVFWTDPEADHARFIGDPGTLMVLRGPILNFKPFAAGKVHLIVFSGVSYGGGTVRLGTTNMEGSSGQQVDYTVPSGAFNAPVLVTPTSAETMTVTMFAVENHQIGLNRVEISVLNP